MMDVILIVALAMGLIAPIVLAVLTHRLYPTDKRISEVFMLVAKRPETVTAFKGGVYTDDRYYVVAVCDLGVLEFWHENRWYAWASNGKWAPVDGNGFEWHHRMPSQAAIRAMRRVVKRDGLLDIGWVRPAKEGNYVDGSRTQ